MRHIFIRPARNNEASKFLEWSKNNTAFDWEIPYYPSCGTVVAYNKNKVIGMIPINQPYMIEGYVGNPEATELETAQALSEFVKFTVAQAHMKGVPEIYFLGTEQVTNDFAVKHVFEKIPYSVYRVKTSDLEPEFPLPQV